MSAKEPSIQIGLSDAKAIIEALVLQVADTKDAKTLRVLKRLVEKYDGAKKLGEAGWLP